MTCEIAGTSSGRNRQSIDASIHERAAVDDERLTGHEVAVRRSEEHRRADEVDRLLHATKRSRAENRRAVFGHGIVGVLLR